MELYNFLNPFYFKNTTVLRTVSSSKWWIIYHLSKRYDLRFLDILNWGSQRVSLISSLLLTSSCKSLHTLAWASPVSPTPMTTVPMKFILLTHFTFHASRIRQRDDHAIEGTCVSEGKKKKHKNNQNPVLSLVALGTWLNDLTS